MRLILSVATQGDAELLDVVVECSAGARVRDVARALATRVPGASVQVVPRGSGHLGVVQVGPGSGAAPKVWWHGEPLDDDVLVELSPLRHGAVIGLGSPPEAGWAEPVGALEVDRKSVV